MVNELLILNEESLKDYIYMIRGQKVMIDSDLAKIYGYTTKDFNRQVKNNIERFDDDFRFQLTDLECESILRCKNFTSSLNANYGGRRYNPYAFTESGIYMLMTVLKGEKAIRQSKILIRLFKSMKDYIISDNNITQDYINNIVLKHDIKIDDIDNNIKLLQESFEKLEEKEMKEFLFFAGEVFNSYSKIIDIFNMSKNEIIIIDSYADIKLLDIIKDINRKVIIITRKNNLLRELDINKYNKQYSNLEVIYDNSFHDRYIILDRKLFYSVGTSFNYLGSKTFGINKIDETTYKNLLLNKINSIIKEKVH